MPCGPAGRDYLKPAREFVVALLPVALALSRAFARKHLARIARRRAPGFSHLEFRNYFAAFLTARRITSGVSRIILAFI